MTVLRKLSGRELVKLLSKLGFEAKRQKGSHIILIKTVGCDRIGCTVPLHKELKLGTIKGILKQACVSEEELCLSLGKPKRAK